MFEVIAVYCMSLGCFTGLEAKWSDQAECAYAAGQMLDSLRESYNNGWIIVSLECTRREETTP